MRKHRRKQVKTIALALAVITTLAAALVLNKNTIIRYIYHHRYFDGPPMESKRKDLAIAKTLNFKFTPADAEFINSFANAIFPVTHRWRPVDLELNDENYPVEIAPFKNDFKHLRVNDLNWALSLRFQPGKYHERIRRFDLFQVDRIDPLEQELVYGLARKLGIFVPHTEYVDIDVFSIHNRISFFKQAYDDIFLEQNKMPHAVIFMIGGKKDRQDRRREIDYLYNEYDNARDPGVFDYLNRFLAQLETGDPHLLSQYFDLDYIAGFETLRRLLGADWGFLVDDGVKFIYNTANGKIYPILDESNLYNLQVNKEDAYFKIVKEQIEKGPLTPLLKKKQRAYLALLAEDYDEIILNYEKLKKRYYAADREKENLYNHLRVKLVFSYFENNVYKVLERYKVRRAPGGISRAAVKGMNLPTAAGTANRQNPWSAAEKYLGLHFQLAGDKRIILRKGEYIVRETVAIPMGYIFEIEPGTIIRMAPGISFINCSPIHIRGTAANPVVIRALKEGEPFGAWAVSGVPGFNDAADVDAAGEGEETSTVEFLDFSGGDKAFLDGSFYTGALNFHAQDVEIKNSNIHHTYGGTGLNVQRAKVLLENNRFYANPVAQATLDFCRGTIIDNEFSGDASGEAGEAGEAACGLELGGCQCIVTGNVFTRFPGKGLIVGEDSRCFLYGNVFRRNRTGLSVKNGARALALENKFQGNTAAVSVYRDNPMYDGGFVYLSADDLSAAEPLSITGKESRIYRLDDADREKYTGEFDRLNAAGQPNGILAVFDGIAGKYKDKGNRIAAFYIGGREVKVDEENRVIFVALPMGAAARQKIYCKARLEKTAVFIKPLCRGIKDPDKKDSGEFRLDNNASYDFKAYIFYGRVILEHEYRRDEYDLYVTTGDLPIVEIDTAGDNGVPRVIKNEPKVPCKIRIFSASDAANRQAQYKSYTGKTLEARIEGRGKKLPKWKYGITLEESYPLEGMGDSRRWVLESSFIEKSLMRNKIAMDLLEQFREDKSRRRTAPQSRFVEVMLNGAYHGVYLLMEHIDKNFLGLEAYDKNRDFNAVLYRARDINANFSAHNFKSFHKKDYKNFPGGRQPLEKAGDPLWGWHSGYEQRYPDPGKYGELWQPVEELTRFTALAPDNEFEARIFHLLDRDSTIDLWIFTQLVYDSDGLYKNRYLARDRGENAGWYIIPWDKDGVLGRQYNMEKTPATQWLTTHLFERCMKMASFREALKARWKELTAKAIISGPHIFQMIDQNVALLKDGQGRNFARWPADYYLYPDANGFYREIDYLKAWLRERIEWLNGEFGRWRR